MSNESQPRKIVVEVEALFPMLMFILIALMMIMLTLHWIGEHVKDFYTLVDQAALRGCFDK